MSVPILNFSEYGSHHQPPLLILHGFLGSSKNWATIAKIISKDFHVFAIDLRNHGESFHHHLHTYELMVEDIKNLLIHLSLDRVNILGHSMGGKVAMKFACNYPENLLKLIIVDIAPKKYFPDRKEIVSMQKIDLIHLISKQSAEDQIALDIPDLGLRKFLLTNLVQDKEGRFSWRINLSVFSREIPNLGENSLHENDKYFGATLFVVGGKSNFIKEIDYPIIYKHFPEAEVEVISNADHNPHFTAREKFLSLIVQFLNQ